MYYLIHSSEQLSEEGGKNKITNIILRKKIRSRELS
jgi:hypothetical protein